MEISSCASVTPRKRLFVYTSTFCTPILFGRLNSGFYFWKAESVTLRRDGGHEAPGTARTPPPRIIQFDGETLKRSFRKQAVVLGMSADLFEEDSSRRFCDVKQEDTIAVSSRSDRSSICDLDHSVTPPARPCPTTCLPLFYDLHYCRLRALNLLLTIL